MTFAPNATFPAALSRAPIGPAWLTGSLVGECLAQMLDRSVDQIDDVRREASQRVLDVLTPAQRRTLHEILAVVVGEDL